MYRIFRNKFVLILIIVFLVGISGCSGIMENMPAPPDMLVKIELNGPYDKEIPGKLFSDGRASSHISESKLSGRTFGC